MGPTGHEPDADAGGPHLAESAGDRRDQTTPLVKAWCLYNWADHGWATPVAAVLIGPWMLALADNAVGDHGTLIALGGLRLRADAYPSAMITVAALVQLFILPVLGSAADARATKRRWLGVACAAGSAVCVVLAFTGGSEWLLVGLLFVAGSVIEGVSDLAWNGMLPELAAPGDRDRISSRATAVGYLGAGLLLSIELALVDLHGTLGLDKGDAVRLCFAFAGLWWAGFGWRALRGLDPPRRPLGGSPAAPRQVPTLRASVRLLRSLPQTYRFVVAYLCFADATSAVIALASTFLTHQLFANNTTKATPFLFELILIIQFIAMLGALTFLKLAKRWGAKRALIVGLVIWCAVIIFAYAVLNTKVEAVVAGVAIGVALGGTVSLARSLFSQMIPVGLEATWFGIYEICSQGTAWMAPLLFTIVVDATGSFRQAILSLILLFVVGLIVLCFVDIDEATREAAAASPS